MPSPSDEARAERSTANDVARSAHRGWDGSGFRQAAGATWVADWTEFSAGNAVRCLPGMALPLLLGIALGMPALGVVAAGGALTAGFGSFQRLRGSCVAPMLLASLGISLSAFTGTLFGHTSVGFVLISALWAYGCGLLAVLSIGAWWIGLQCAVFALIASHYPEGLGPAFSRAVLVAAGGLMQTLLILGVERGTRPKGPSDASLQSTSLWQAVTAAVRTVRANSTPRTPTGREALRLALAVAVAAAASRIFSLPNGYWMPMTVLLVLKADLYETLTRGLGRIAGTLLGAGLATLLAATLRPGPLTLALLVVLFSWLCYTLLRVNYALFTLSITSYVAFQLALVGLPESAVVTARVLCTLLGGLVALLAHLLWQPGASEATRLPEQARAIE